MVGSRTLTAAAGVAVSLILSAVLWYAFGTAVFFLFVPFVPFLFRGTAAPGSGGSRDPEEAVRTCPACGFRTRDPAHEFCPRDGTRLN